MDGSGRDGSIYISMGTTRREVGKLGSGQPKRGKEMKGGGLKGSWTRE
jgi:hypothetical protein